MADDPGADARRTAPRRIYSGKGLSLDVDEVVEPGDVRATREVVRHTGSAAVLAVDAQDRVLLVRQYRYAVGEALWELPAGRIDPGETPEDGARRELEEEAGIRAERLERLAFFYTTPGFCDERMSVFRATELTEVPARPEKDERIERRWFAAHEVDAMVDAGEVREGKTLVALLKERLFRQTTR